MEKRQINSILLGILVILVAFIISNLLQFLVIDNLLEYIDNNKIEITESLNYDVIIKNLTDNTIKTVMITRVLYFTREVISFLGVYYLIKFLSKKYYIKIVKVQNTLFTIIGLYGVILINILMTNERIGIVNILYMLFCLIIYFVIIDKFLVDKEDADNILKLKKEQKLSKREIYDSQGIKCSNDKEEEKWL